MINKIAIEFMTFIKVNSSVDSAYVDNPPMHYELADKLLSKDLFVLVEVFRGGAKTTLVEWLMVFIAFKGGALPFTYRKRIRNIKWFSSTERNLKGSLYSIADKKIDFEREDVLSPLHKKYLPLIRKAMREVVANPRGTGFRYIHSKVKIAGKTGTAQVVGIPQSEKKRMKESELEYYHRSHAWFTTYGPYKHPKYVVLVMVEHGGHGGAAAGGIVSKIYNKLYEDHKC